MKNEPRCIAQLLRRESLIDQLHYHSRSRTRGIIIEPVRQVLSKLRSLVKKRTVVMTVMTLDVIRSNQQHFAV